MENRNLIRHIAFMFAKKSGLEIKDLMQEAELAYFEAMRTYDPSKARISTYVWNCVSNRLTTYWKEVSIPVAEDITGVEVETKTEFTMDSLVPEAQEIVKILLSKADEFDIPDWEQKRIRKDKQKKVRTKLAQMLSGMGWSKEKINVGFNNLQVIYSN